MVWQLLLHLDPLDIARLYQVDRAHFLEAYQRWPESKKRWAIEYLSERQAG